MEQVNQQPPGGQQAFPQTNQQEKQLMTILGVQGLSYQNSKPFYRLSGMPRKLFKTM